MAFLDKQVQVGAAMKYTLWDRWRNMDFSGGPLAKERETSNAKYWKYYIPYTLWCHLKLLTLTIFLLGFSAYGSGSEFLMD